MMIMIWLPGDLDKSTLCGGVLGKKKKKKRRHRTIFTSYQLEELEKAFKVCFTESRIKEIRHWWLGCSLPWRLCPWNAQSQDRPPRGQNSGQCGYWLIFVLMEYCHPNQFEPAVRVMLAQIPGWSVISMFTGTNPRPYYIPIMIHHSRLKGAPRVPGLVSEPASQGAKDEQDLGPGEHHGGVRAVRGHGAPLPPPPRCQIKSVPSPARTFPRPQASAHVAAATFLGHTRHYMSRSRLYNRTTMRKQAHCRDRRLQDIAIGNLIGCHSGGRLKLEERKYALFGWELDP